MSRKTLAALAVTAAAARWAGRARRRLDLAGKVALVTGGSAGLGLATARRFVGEGARVAICGRDETALKGAANELGGQGATVMWHACNVADRDAVAGLVGDIVDRLGPVDVLVNNAGVIDLGEVAADSTDVFAHMLDVMFWGTVHPTLAVLPAMRERRFGRIANVTSIGARVSAPHLVPYSCAKHAAYAFSQGLRAELAADGIRVTTVVPGLMHTGSHRAALVRGGHPAEYAWFALAGANALLASDPARAADRVVQAVRLGDPHAFIGLDARMAARAEALAPGTTARALSLVARALPDTAAWPPGRAPGWSVETPVTRSPLTSAGRRAAKDLQRHRPGVAEPDAQPADESGPHAEEEGR